MKPIGEMSIDELAAFVCERLAERGITVTLTGGACVGIWSNWKYVSHDLDFIEEGPVTRNELRSALVPLGFVEQGRHFAHPESEWLVEFPTGPLMVGDQRVTKVSTHQTAVGTLRLLSPTDCVKNRLAAFYHWNDKQSLVQAIWVALAHRVDLNDIQKWSIEEGAKDKYAKFKTELTKTRKRDSSK